MGTVTSNTFDVTVTAVPNPDFIIPNTWDYHSDGYWNGDSPPAGHAQAGQTSVSPGDIIQLEAGVREPIFFTNINGVLGNRVVIRSDPAGQVIIKRAVARSGNFICLVQNSYHFDFDGSYTSGQFHGFKIMSDVSGDTPSSFFRLQKYIGDCTIRNIEVSGGYPATTQTGIGFTLAGGSLAFGGITSQDLPWYENIIHEHCWTHHTAHSGFYIGGNYSDTGGPPRDQPPLRNCEIRYCKNNDSGRRAFSIKMGQTGTGNRIHHNYGIRHGLKFEATDGFRSGATFFEGMGEFDHNWLEDTSWHGLSCTALYTPGTVTFAPLSVHDNIFVDAGLTADTTGSAVQVGSPTGFAIPESVSVYNNTIIGSKSYGVDMNSSIDCAVTVQNNILSDNGSGTVRNLGSGPSVITPNETGSEAAQNFGSNYTLTASSPAQDAATSGLVSSTDNAGLVAWVAAGADPETSIEDYVNQDKARPLGANECRGALEFVE